MTPGQLGRAGRTVLAVPCIYLDTRVPQPSPTLWDFSEFNIGGFPVSQALSVCWLHKAMEGKRTWPWEANEEGKVCVHLTISQLLLQTTPGTEKAVY